MQNATDGLSRNTQHRVALRADEAALNLLHHADAGQLAQPDDAEVAISFAEPGAISEGEP